MKQFIFSLLIVAISYPALAAGGGGNTVGNGGDGVAEEFVVEGRQAINLLSCIKLELADMKIVLTMLGNVDLTEVNSSQAPLWLRGRQVDAINFPAEHKILVSRERWNGLLLDNIATRVTLVLHEYLGVSGFDDSEYKISQRLVAKIRNRISENNISVRRFRTMLGTFSSKLLTLNSDLNTARMIGRTNLQSFCQDSGAIGTYAELTSEIISDNIDWFSLDQFRVMKAADAFIEISADLNRQCFTQKVDLDKAQKENDQLMSAISALIWDISQ